jgi:hypothetical protein
MRKAKTVPPTQAEAAVEAAAKLEAHAASVLKLAQRLRDEVEMAGEVPDDFVRRLEGLVVDQQQALETLVAQTRKR